MLRVGVVLLSMCFYGAIGEVRARGVAGPMRSADYTAAQSRSNLPDELKATCIRSGGNTIGTIYYGNTTCVSSVDGWVCETPGSTSCWRVDD